MELTSKRDDDYQERNSTTRIVHDKQGNRWKVLVDGRTGAFLKTELIPPVDDLPDDFDDPPSTMDRILDKDLALDSCGPRGVYVQVVTDVFLSETIVWSLSAFATFFATYLTVALETRPDMSPIGSFTVLVFAISFLTLFVGTYLGLLFLRILNSSSDPTLRHTLTVQWIAFIAFQSGLFGSLFAMAFLFGGGFMAQFAVTNWATALAILLVSVRYRKDIETIPLALSVFLIGVFSWTMCLLHWGGEFVANIGGHTGVLAACILVALARCHWVIRYARGENDYSIDENRRAWMDVYLRSAVTSLGRCGCGRHV